MRTVRCISILGLGLVLAAPVFAAPPEKPPCGTQGPVQATTISPAQYSYTLGESGNQSFSFTVSSPGIQVTGNCDNSLAPVFGTSPTIRFQRSAPIAWMFTSAMSAGPRHSRAASTSSPAAKAANCNSGSRQGPTRTLPDVRARYG